MTTFVNLLREHTEAEEKKFENIENQLSIIRDNHLRHIEADVQAMKIQGTALSTDMAWVKWSVFAVLGALIAGGIGLIFIK